MNKEVDALIEGTKTMLALSEKRTDVIEQFYKFLTKETSLDNKRKAFKSNQHNKGVDLDGAIINYFASSDKKVNKENISNVISAINHINSYTNTTHNTTFPLTHQNIDKVISIHKQDVSQPPRQTQDLLNNKLDAEKQNNTAHKAQTQSMCQQLRSFVSNIFSCFSKKESAKVRLSLLENAPNDGKNSFEINAELFPRRLKKADSKGRKSQGR